MNKIRRITVIRYEKSPKFNLIIRLMSHPMLTDKAWKCKKFDHEIKIQPKNKKRDTKSSIKL